MSLFIASTRRYFYYVNRVSLTGVGMHRCDGGGWVTGVKNFSVSNGRVSSGSPSFQVVGRVQWVSFAGFYQKEIIKSFVESAERHSVSGFLAHGKPAVACLEGRDEDIQRFLKHVRVVVFATVPRGARKMTLGLCEGEKRIGEGNVNQYSRMENHTEERRGARFKGFTAQEFFSRGSHHRGDMLDRARLDEFLLAHGVPESVRRRVGQGVTEC